MGLTLETRNVTSEGLEEVHYGGEGPHWAVVPIKEKIIIIIIIIIRV